MPILTENQLLTLVVGAPQTLEVKTPGVPLDLSIALNPGSGGTLLAQYRIHASDVWRDCPAGTVSVTTVFKLDGKIQAMKFTAAIANGTVAII